MTLEWERGRARCLKKRGRENTGIEEEWKEGEEKEGQEEEKWERKGRIWRKGGEVGCLIFGTVKWFVLFESTKPVVYSLQQQKETSTLTIQLLPRDINIESTTYTEKNVL